MKSYLGQENSNNQEEHVRKAPLIDAYLNDSLYALGFSARYFIVSATDAASFSSLMCKSELGEGAKSRMFGAPITTGTDPASLHELPFISTIALTTINHNFEVVTCEKS